MKLFEILVQGRTKYGASPCAAAYDDSSSTTSSNSTKVLTYRSAYLATLEHERKLRQQQQQHAAEIEVIAFVCSNSIDYLLSLIAATNLQSCRRKVALLNTRWTSSEMAAVLRSSSTNSTTLIVYGPEFQRQAHEIQQKLQHRVRLMPIPSIAQFFMNTLDPQQEERDDSNNLNQTGLGHKNPSDSIKEILQQNASVDDDSGDDAVVVFTSGTTSGSKGVRLSHRALVLQALAKLQPPCRYSRSTKMLATTVPLFHVGGLSSALALLLAGGLWMIPNNRNNSSGFDPSSVIRSMCHPVLAINTLVVVPAMIHALLDKIGQQQQKTTYSGIELILIGGQSATDDMIRTLRGVFPNGRLVQTYACTEAASSMAFADLTTTHNNNNTKATSVSIRLPNNGPVGDCVGIPPPHVTLKLFEKAGSAIVAIDEPHRVGMFGTSGSHLMSGYWIRSDGPSPRQQHQASAWFMTNDLGFMDEDGQFYFCGRQKDTIRTGGETVMALGVERVLIRHHAVAECAVFALPDEKFGEAVCAAVVLVEQQQAAGISLKHVRDFCGRQGLAGYKKPRQLFYVNELPRNSSGKILKYRLVDQFKKATKSKL